MFKSIRGDGKSMSGLSNMKKRLAYAGGAQQVDRMIEDKLKSLKSSMMASYQSAIAIIDNRDFRCLINPNKISMELDDKILSIPFEDVCLTSNEVEKTNVKVGDVITWKGKREEDNTHWLIYSRYLNERAYFRGQMRQCKHEFELTDGGSKYWVYVKGPDEKSIDWQKTKHFIFNDLNYTLEMYISKNTETSEFFHRFKKVKFMGKSYQVEAIDDITTEGIIAVYMKEDYTNPWEEGAQSVPETHTNQDPSEVRIDGPAQLYPYETATYKILNAAGGQWLLSNKRAVILNQNDSSVDIEVTTGRSGDISLIYRADGADDIVLNITILSL